VSVNGNGMRPTRVAVIGAGSMGTNHLRVLHDFDDDSVQLVGVADSDQPTLARAVRRYHVPGFLDYRQLIQETCPDLVSIVVPTKLHFTVAVHALQQGVHTLIEKPITPTVEDAVTLAELARACSRMIAVGHVERFNPAVLALKELVAQGSLGQIYCLHARRIGPFPSRIRDVGVALDLATHDLDVMRYIVGSEPERAYAETRQCIGQEHEDLLFALVRFKTGAVGMLDVNWLTPTKVRELTVTGEYGMYLVNYLSQELYFYQNDYTPVGWDTLRSQVGVSEGTMTRLKIQRQEPLRAEYENVINAVRHGGTPAVTAEDGIAALRLAHQLIGSTHVGGVVPCIA
jgi:UDP-N-acetylglucosamine 3-dehydrogenase